MTEDIGQDPRVAMDADGVLALSYHRFIDEWNLLTGGSYTVDDLTEWPFEKTALGIQNDRYFELYNAMWCERWMCITPAVDEGMLSELTKRFRVDLVSNRTVHQGRMLRKWMEANYPNVQLDIVTVPRIEDKLELGYDVYIDDAATIADGFVRGGLGPSKRLMLVSNPWNKDRGFEGKAGITVVDDLAGAINALLDRKT